MPQICNSRERRLSFMPKTLVSLRLALTVLAFEAMLCGCAGHGPLTGADCSGLTGGYADRGEPSGQSLARLLLDKSVPKGTVVHIDANDGRLQVSAAAARKVLDSGACVCAAPGEVRLLREDIARIHAPPLIDQTRTTSYVLRGGPGEALVLSTYSRTTARPYGLPLTGPLQLDSTTRWIRETH